MTGCNLLASNLVIILTEDLSKEIGLKSFTQIDQSTLGIRVIKELLMLLRHILPL